MIQRVTKHPGSLVVRRPVPVVRAFPAPAIRSRYKRGVGIGDCTGPDDTSFGCVVMGGQLPGGGGSSSGGSSSGGGMPSWLQLILGDALSVGTAFGVGQARAASASAQTNAQYNALLNYQKKLLALNQSPATSGPLSSGIGGIPTQYLVYGGLALGGVLLVSLLK